MSDVSAQPPGSDAPTAESRWMKIDRLLARGGEFLNPILVKECRQALKSKQFMITYLLLLACGWGWTMIGVAQQAGSVYYAEGGGVMLSGYFTIIVIPMLVIIPFSTYRSLAAEREYGTFELLSITTLNSRQIVTGKLWVAALQMLVFYSALAPFIAFTYLLRGVDLLTIGFLLTYTLVMSIGFSCVGLLCGTLTRAAHWQVLVSVVLIAALGLAAFTWIVFAMDVVVREPIPADDIEFWRVNAFVLIIVAATCILFVVAASSQVSFASDNRSTRIRVALLALQSIWMGGLWYLWIADGDDDFLWVMLLPASFFLYFVGALMTGELAELSPRVKRSLPQSALGRVALTWFNPGSGTGYVFISLQVGLLGAVTAGAYYGGGFVNSRVSEDILAGAILAPAYVIGYLGVGRLIIFVARRYFRFGIIVSMIIQVVFAILGVVGPFVFQLMLYRWFGFEYSAMQAGNWAWTMAEVVDRDIFNYGSPLGGMWMPPPVLVIAPASAMFIFLVNLVFAAREVNQVRQAAPDRVVLDDESMAPAVEPQEHALDQQYDDAPEKST